MTAVCGGGASGPKTGTEAVVQYTAGLLASIFAAYDLTWLIPIIPFVGLAPLALSTFCASDPPATSDLTTDEATALLQLQFGPDFDTAIAKVRDYVLNAIWYDACQCTGAGVTATPFDPPTPPSGTPILIIPTNSGVGPCYTFTGRDAPAAGVTIFYDKPPYAPLVPTIVQLDATVLQASGSFTMTLALEARTSANVFIRAYTLAISSATARTGSRTWAIFPGEGDHFRISILNQGSTTLLDTAWSIRIYCGDNIPNGGPLPCCPPDTSTFSYLDSILRMVTLIQRQSAPFAYVTGAEHLGLTGAGELDVQGLLGAKILPSIVPAHAGLEAGDPDVLWIDSWINWGNPDGWAPREFLRAAPHVSLPALCGQYTKLGYSLAPGVTVDVTELVREPS